MSTRAPSRRTLLAAGLIAPWAAGVRAQHTRPLVVAAFPLLDKIIERALPAWRRVHPGVEVQVVSRQYIDHHTAMTTALSTGSRLPDVMALELSFVGRFAHGKGLEDLRQAPYGIEGLRPGWVAYAYDQAVNRAGEVIAAPADVGPGTMLYRTDLAERAGVSVEDLTRSWDSYLEAGATFKAATGAYLIANVQTVKDIVVRAGLGAGDGIYFDRESRVTVDVPRFHRAFALAREIRRRKLDARLTAWSNEWAEALKRGTLATELSGAWIVGQLSNWIAPQTAGAWRAAPFPEGAQASYGGAFYAIPRRAAPERKRLAWDFVRLMTRDHALQVQAFKGFDAFPALVATHDDAFFGEPLPFLGGQRARLLWRDAARRITAAPVHKQSPFANEVVSAALDRVLDQGQDIATALGDAQRLIERRALR